MKTKHIINATANLIINVLHDHYVTYGITIMSKNNNKNAECVAVYQFHTVLGFFLMTLEGTKKKKSAPLPSPLLLSLFD